MSLPQASEKLQVSKALLDFGILDNGLQTFAGRYVQILTSGQFWGSIKEFFVVMAMLASPVVLDVQSEGKRVCFQKNKIQTLK